MVARTMREGRGPRKDVPCLIIDFVKVYAGANQNHGVFSTRSISF
jgi:hypothetical protein